ncbi:MAG: hypothetical protein A3A81_06415 [Omnitrophica bacterium RIFCSPLOWO2_01_FULL_45_10b]|nr:MAG: hypothetical protein A3A81_06415 [Omnitrophica bacterium RIFCSPLOWO2_01_FULL_45_10b]
MEQGQLEQSAPINPSRATQNSQDDKRFQDNDIITGSWNEQPRNPKWFRIEGSAREPFHIVFQDRGPNVKQNEGVAQETAFVGKK